MHSDRSFLGLRSLNYDLLRAIHLLPPSERAKLHANVATFSSLWFSGRLTGQAMRDVLCEWAILMRSVGLDPATPLPASIVATVKPLADRVRLPDVQDCDPELAKFLDLLRWAVETCGVKAEVQS